MKRVGDFFKRLKVEGKVEDTTKSNDTQEVQIEIEDNINLFKDEKEKIIQGAKQLLRIGKAESMEDAIITYATMFRGLKFSNVRLKKEKQL